MKAGKLARGAFFFGALTLALVFGALPVYAGTISVDVNDPACVTGSGQPTPYLLVYCNIQDAIDDALAGDTISIAAGVYSIAATINANKDDLVLLGPQANIDPRPSFNDPDLRTEGDASEAIIQSADADPDNYLSNIILVAANNVEINGLEIRRGQGDLIRQSLAYSGTIVRYCMVYDSHDASGAGDEGIQLKKCGYCTIEYNFVDFVDGDGINIASNSEHSAIQYNEITNFESAYGGIYVYGSSYIDVIGNLIHSGQEANNSGIRFGTSFVDSGNEFGSIVNNTIHDVRTDGIRISQAKGTIAGDILVAGNEIYNVDSVTLGWAGITIDYASEYILIEKNDIYNNPMGVHIAHNIDVPLLPDPDPATILLNDNNIFNNNVTGPNVGIVNDSDIGGILDAEGNWWGDASGPADAAGANEVPPCTGDPTTEINADGSGDSVGGTAADDIDYCPWLGIAYATPTPTPTPTYTPTLTPTITPGGPTATPLPVPTSGGAGVMLMVLLMTASLIAVLGRRVKN